MQFVFSTSKSIFQFGVEELAHPDLKASQHVTNVFTVLIRLYKCLMSRIVNQKHDSKNI